MNRRPRADLLSNKSRPRASERCRYVVDGTSVGFVSRDSGGPCRRHGQTVSDSFVSSRALMLVSRYYRGIDGKSALAAHNNVLKVVNRAAYNIHYVEELAPHPFDIVRGNERDAISVGLRC